MEFHMERNEAEKRISIDPNVMSGVPVIAGTRVPVSLIVNYLENGHLVAELLDDYPNLTEADVEAALAYARIPEFDIVRTY